MMETTGANGSDTDWIVVKLYSYLFLFFGYGSDIRWIRMNTNQWYNKTNIVGIDSRPESNWPKSFENEWTEDSVTQIDMF